MGTLIQFTKSSSNKKWYMAGGGETLKQSLASALAQANEHQTDVRFDFNCNIIVVNPGDDITLIEEEYSKRWNDSHEKFLAYIQEYGKEKIRDYPYGDDYFTLDLKEEYAPVCPVASNDLKG